MENSPNHSDPAPGFADHYDFRADFPGETLHYLEEGRQVSMTWTWNNAYRIYKDSMEDWTYADGTRRPVTDAEREEIIRRAVVYARNVQGVNLIVEP